MKSGDFIGFHYDEVSDNVFSVIPVSADDDTPEAFVFNLKHSDIAWSGQRLLFRDVNKIMSGSFGYKNVTGSSIIGKPLLAASVYSKFELLHFLKTMFYFSQILQLLNA